MKAAIVAIEDRRFYQHQGFDWQGTIRAVELANVGATLASGGKWCPPSPIESVTDANGQPVSVTEAPCNQTVEGLANTLLTALSKDDTPEVRRRPRPPRPGWDHETAAGGPARAGAAADRPPLHRRRRRVPRPDRGPDVTGREENDARSILERAGWKVSTRSIDNRAPEGTIVGQNPNGTALPERRFCCRSAAARSPRRRHRPDRRFRRAEIPSLRPSQLSPVVSSRRRPSQRGRGGSRRDR